MAGDKKLAQIASNNLAYVKESLPPLEPLSKSTDGVNIKPGATGVKSENETTSEKPK